MFIFSNQVNLEIFQNRLILFIDYVNDKLFLNLFKNKILSLKLTFITNDLIILLYNWCFLFPLMFINIEYVIYRKSR